MIVGIDEAGRGPLAGPVVAAAVILNPQKPIAGLMDSKALSAKKRSLLALQIQKDSLDYSLGEATVEEIEKYNILQATLLAMQRAVESLQLSPSHIFIDGLHSPKLAYPTQTMVKGDQLHPAISAASILAKVTRDEIMRSLDADYPEYGFAKHKGYGTAQHIAALKRYGYTVAHRISFSPVKSCFPRQT